MRLPENLFAGYQDDEVTVKRKPHLRIQQAKTNYLRLQPAILRFGVQGDLFAVELRQACQD